MSILDDVKLILNIVDNSHDNLLMLYEKQAKQKINLRLGVSKTPSLFDYIVVDYIVFKYRKRGTEDATSVGEDSLSKSLISDKDFFEQYQDEFNRYKHDRENKDPKRKLRFIG